MITNERTGSNHRRDDRTPSRSLVFAVVVMSILGFGVAGLSAASASFANGLVPGLASQVDSGVHTTSTQVTASVGSITARMGPEITPRAPAGGSPLTPTTPGCAGSPCPMGITDYGITPSFGAYAESPYVVNSTYDIKSLSIGVVDADICQDTDAVQGQCFTLQQNAVTHNTYVENNKGSYWTQDVAQIAYDKTCSSPCKSGTYSLSWLDNIWNFSSAKGICPTNKDKGPGCINPANIIGNAGGKCSGSGGQPEFYYCVGPTVYGLKPPFNVTATMDIDGSGPCKVTTDLTCVNFFGEVQNSAGKVLQQGYYDGVKFKSGAHGAGSPTYYIHDTFSPFGDAYDFEWDVAGPGDGYSNTVTVVGTMQSFVCNTAACPTGSQTTIKHAWSSGEDTAEEASGVVVKATPKVSHEASTSSGTDNSQVHIW
jgi:hypothetical protein